MNQRFVGEILVRRGALTEEALDEALIAAEERKAPLSVVLINRHIVEESVLVKALADELGMKFEESIDTDAIPEDLIDLVPISFARQHHVLAISREGDFPNAPVNVAISDPLNVFALDDMRALLGTSVEPIAIPSEQIDDAINRVYERKDEAALGEKEDSNQQEELKDLIDMNDEAPVIRWVNNLFYTAVREGASDIHIEPGDEVIVRYRIDGKLQKRKTAHKGFLASIVSRVKIEAKLNIAEKRLPQDGRISIKVAGKPIDIRVSTIPTADGERVVMRLLDKEGGLVDLNDLGFDSGQEAAVRHAVSRPNGIILVTGPTGSGKTTTLYSFLKHINTPDKNILTAEDPVEYELAGIGQMQVQSKIGLTFASGLRAFLRQDPDVIMVGEIRDHETAEIAIHASLTGHLVLSTLHTNDAPGAITRMSDMGVQPFLISSSLLAVLAQRLVRRLCPHCKQPYHPSDEDLSLLGIDASKMEAEIEELSRDSVPKLASRSGEFDIATDGDDQIPFASDDLAGALEPDVPGVLGTDDPFSSVQRQEMTQVFDRNNVSDQRLSNVSGQSKRPVFYRPRGCEECTQGYRGRLGIFELMIIDDPVRREIIKQSDANTIAKVAIKQGMRTLRDDGARKVLEGVTTVDEVLAATQAGGLE